jgi:hypothetical protein
MMEKTIKSFFKSFHFPLASFDKFSQKYRRRALGVQRGRKTAAGCTQYGRATPEAAMAVSGMARSQGVEG